MACCRIDIMAPQEGRKMIDACVVWACAHPLQAVAAMVAVGVGAGLLLINRLHEIVKHDPPRC